MATTPAQLAEAGERLCMAPAALAGALAESSGRLLIDDAGNAVLLRRQLAEDGAAEAVIVSRAGVPQDHPGVLAAAAGWGCDRVRHQLTGRTVDVTAPSSGAPLVDRFRHRAALAATRVEAAVALARDDDSRPSSAVDDAAHEVAVALLGFLGVPVLSRQRPDRSVPSNGPWIVLDPRDGSGNVAAFSAALVSDGRPVAGLVADLSSGRRWSGAAGAGAERDGVPVTRSGSGIVPPTSHPVRLTGCTAVDLCLVADGSAAGWQGDSSVHHVSGGLAVLLAAGGVALTPDGEPLVLGEQADERLRFVAASDLASARELLRAVG